MNVGSEEGDQILNQTSAILNKGGGHVKKV